MIKIIFKVNFISCPSNPKKSSRPKKEQTNTDIEYSPKFRSRFIFTFLITILEETAVRNNFLRRHEERNL